MGGVPEVLNLWRQRYGNCRLNWAANTWGTPSLFIRLCRFRYLLVTSQIGCRWNPKCHLQPLVQCRLPSIHHVYISIPWNGMYFPEKLLNWIKFKKYNLHWKWSFILFRLSLALSCNLGWEVAWRGENRKQCIQSYKAASVKFFPSFGGETRFCAFALLLGGLLKRSKTSSCT